MFKKVLQTIAAAMTLCLTMHLAIASEIVKVPTAWLGEHEAFLMWYAKEKGWDAEAGLDIQMQLFDSGPDILNALPSGKWVYAGMGAVPPCSVTYVTVHPSSPSATTNPDATR